MDKKTLIIIIAVVVVVAIIIYLLYKHFITTHTTTPTTTKTTTTTTTTPTPTTTSPTTTPTPTPTITPPSSPIVTVNYYYNGQVNSITLPTQAGTTIQFTYRTNLYINGNGAQPGQQVILTVYEEPNGQQVYITSTTAESNGSFSMTVPSSYLFTNVQYKIVLSLGSNYYFYAVPVYQSSSSSSFSGSSGSSSSSSSVSSSFLSSILTVVVKYCYNGQVNSITLPTQAGTTIQFDENTDIYINGTTQPGQIVTVTVYLSSGYVEYSARVTAGSDGSFSITIPSHYWATPGEQYLIVVFLGYIYTDFPYYQNYEFYAQPVFQYPPQSCPGLSSSGSSSSSSSSSSTSSSGSNTYTVVNTCATTLEFVMLYKQPINGVTSTTISLPPGYSDTVSIDWNIVSDVYFVAQNGQEIASVIAGNRITPASCPSS